MFNMQGISHMKLGQHRSTQTAHISNIFTSQTHHLMAKYFLLLTMCIHLSSWHFTDGAKLVLIADQHRHPGTMHHSQVYKSSAPSSLTSGVHHASTKRAVEPMFQKRQKCEVHKDPPLHAMLDKLCFDCQMMFGAGDPDFHYKCSDNCFGTPQFESCWAMAGGGPGPFRK